MARPGIGVLPRRFLTWTVQLVSIAGMLGFVVGVGLNSLVFSAWGLNFLQLATPSDVIMSGFEIALWAFSNVVAGLVGLVIGRALGRTKFYLWVLALTGVLWAAVTGFISFFSDEIDESIFNLFVISNICTFIIGTATGTAYTSGIVGVYDSIRNGSFATIMLNKKFNLVLFSLSIIIVMCMMVIAILSRLQEFGFHRPPIFIETDKCFSRVGQVYWTGANAVVARCEDDSFVVILGPENLTLYVANTTISVD